MVTVSVGRVFKVIQLDEEQASRFWDNVALADDNGCMVWRGVKAPNGYGHFAAKGTKFWRTELPGLSPLAGFQLA